MSTTGTRPPISATDAAFSGLALARRHPAAFGIWTAVTLAYGLLATGLQAWLAGPALLRLSVPTDPASITSAQVTRMLGDLGSLSLFYVVMLLAALVFGAVMNAAVFRAVLRPADGGQGFIRLGADELRQAGVSVLVGLVIYGVYIVALLIGVVLLFVGAVIVVALNGGKSDTPSPGVIAIAVVGSVALVALLVAPVLIAAIRLSLAGPATFARGKVDAMSSWTLTKGRFGMLFGAYLLAALAIVVFSLLIFVVVAIAATAAGASLTSVSHGLFPDPKAPESLVSPLRLVILVLNAPLSALWLVTAATIPATIYAQLVESGRGPGAAAVDRSHVFGTPVAYPAPPPPDGL